MPSLRRRTSVLWSTSSTTSGSGSASTSMAGPSKPHPLRMQVQHLVGLHQPVLAPRCLPAHQVRRAEAHDARAAQRRDPLGHPAPAAATAPRAGWRWARTPSRPSRSRRPRTPAGLRSGRARSPAGGTTRSRGSPRRGTRSSRDRAPYRKHRLKQRSCRLPTVGSGIPLSKTEYTHAGKPPNGPEGTPCVGLRAERGAQAAPRSGNDSDERQSQAGATTWCGGCTCTGMARTMRSLRPQAATRIPEPRGRGGT